MTLTHEPWLLFSTFFVSFLGLSFHRTHLLSTLLCLEAMMMAIFVGLSLWSTNLSLASQTMFPLAMLTMSACEAGLGLSLMVATARTHGTDNLNSLNLLQC